MNVESRSRSRIALAGLLALLLPGCVGYRLGSMLPADIRTVYVQPVANRTDEPLVEVEARQAAIREIQRDGSLKVVNDEAGADAWLQVVLTGYSLNPIAYRQDQATAAEEYKLVLTASMLLTRRRGGAVVVESPRISGQATFALAGDLTSSKTAALPEAAADLGRRIVAGMVEAWP